MAASEGDGDEGMLMFMRGSDESEEEIVGVKYDTYEYILRGEKNSVSLALVSKHHSLWAEYIYNASRIIADLMIDHVNDPSNPHSINVHGLKCLELGAGAGLPGFIAGVCGASEVVISDYGLDYDLSLIFPIDVNIKLLKSMVANQNLYGIGYIWGYPVHPLVYAEQYYHSSSLEIDCGSYKDYIASKLAARKATPEFDSAVPVLESDKFDVIILADLIFNRSEHEKLLWTVKEALKPKTGVCYVSFSHHDPLKRMLDLNFFELARAEPFNLTVEYILQQQRRSHPFTENDGLDGERGVVYLYKLTLA